MICIKTLGLILILFKDYGSSNSKLLSGVSKISEISCCFIKRAQHNPRSDTVLCVLFYKEIGCLQNAGDLTKSQNKHF